MKNINTPQVMPKSVCFLHKAVIWAQRYALLEIQTSHADKP